MELDKRQLIWLYTMNELQENSKEVARGWTS